MKRSCSVIFALHQALQVLRQLFGILLPSGAREDDRSDSGKNQTEDRGSHQQRARFKIGELRLGFGCWRGRLAHHPDPADDQPKPNEQAESDPYFEGKPLTIDCTPSNSDGARSR